MAPSGRLEGKVAIVTGAGSTGSGWGNGKATSVLYAREGASVVLVDRDADALAETRHLIESEGGRCLPVVTDVSKREEVEAMVAEATEWGDGRIDVLHNNVGIGVVGPLAEVKDKRWQLVFDVNVKSVMLCSQAALPWMEAAGGGSIINTSSVASLRWTGVPYPAYAASKAAVNQLTQSIALEYAAHGIRCNVIVIGYLDTPIVYAGQVESRGTSHEDLARQRHAVCPMGHMGDAWDVAHAGLFLASDESRYVTGTQLVVDGGLSAVCAEGLLRSSAYDGN